MLRLSQLLPKWRPLSDFLFIGILLAATQTTNAQCYADIQVEPDGLGSYSFLAVNLVDTSEFSQYNFTVNGSSLLSAPQSWQAIANFDSNGLYDVCFHLEDTSTSCLFDTCFVLEVIDAEYIPMLNSLTVWHLFHDVCPVKTDETSSGIQHIDGVSVVATGDTQIAGVGYKFINDTGGWNLNDGLIREDLVERIVYYWPTHSQFEFPLYDYGMLVGDSIYLPFIQSGLFEEGYYTLDSIQIRTIQLTNRRVFFLSGQTQWGAAKLSWVEGLGFLGHPIYTAAAADVGCGLLYDCSQDYIPEQYQWRVICVEHDTTVYNDDCAVQVALNDPCICFEDSCIIYNCCSGVFDSRIKHQLSISPNPGNGSVEIGLSEPLTSRTTLTVTDFKGAILREEDVSEHIGKSELTFNFSDLIPGIYFVTIQSEASLEFGKLLIH